MSTPDPDLVVEHTTVVVPGVGSRPARWTWYPGIPWECRLTFHPSDEDLVVVPISRVLLRWACMGAHPPSTTASVVVYRHHDGTTLGVDVPGTPWPWLTTPVDGARRFLSRTTAVVDMCRSWWSCRGCAECEALHLSVLSMIGEE